MSKFQFSNVVVVEENLVGVVVKSWESNKGRSHEVYVRSFNGIKTYPEDEITHLIYDKELSAEQLEYY